MALPLWCLTSPPSHPRFGWATKRKRLNGQARRLISPNLHILCRMCTVGQQPEGNHLPPISISRHSAAKTSPSGGGAVGRRGAFPRAPTRLACFPRPSGRFACFPSGDSPVVKVLFILAAQPPTTTLSGEAAVKL